jgi:hypothetical protein
MSVLWSALCLQLLAERASNRVAPSASCTFHLTAPPGRHGDLASLLRLESSMAQLACPGNASTLNARIELMHGWGTTQSKGGYLCGSAVADDACRSGPRRWTQEPPLTVEAKAPLELRSCKCCLVPGITEHRRPLGWMEEWKNEASEHRPRKGHWPDQEALLAL